MASNKRTPPEHKQYLPASRILAEGDDKDMRRKLSRISRRTFFGFGASALASIAGWKWLMSRDEEDGVQWPFRRALETNERLARDYFSPTHLAKTYDPSDASNNPRVNGGHGLKSELDLTSWSLTVSGLHESAFASDRNDTTNVGAASGDSLSLSLDDIKKLPYVEMTTELRCIEGWTEIIHWGGARFQDFAAKYPPATISGDMPDVRNKQHDVLPYVAMSTPDGGYYVGLDTDSVLHPQTLLCYAINGKPLTNEHGAPLRLVVPVKYGVKNIKRIGLIAYTSRRPADFWAERGYDWYAGL